MLADREGGGKRTLDLQANSHDEVSVWTRYFRQVVEALTSPLAQAEAKAEAEAEAAPLTLILTRAPPLIRWSSAGSSRRMLAAWPCVRSLARPSSR